MTTDRRILDRGRRFDDCSHAAGVALMLIYGACVGFIAGYMVRAWWG